jgi:GWxTD domain-containing protein
MRHRAAVVLFLAASAMFAGEPQGPVALRDGWNQPVPEWWEGPVRYALTDDETREYKSLATRAERASFIARFWAARDPDPFTPINEMEDDFWKRVSAADELFTQTTISGWRTDQGRVYIVLGPPDEITSYPVPSVEQLDPSHFPDPYKRWDPMELRPGVRGAVEWVYHSLKSPLADAGQTVTFVRNESGEYLISGRLASTFRYEPNLEMHAMNDAAQAIGQASRGGRSGNAFTGSSAGLVSTGPTRVHSDAAQIAAFQAVDDAQAYASSIESSFAAGQAALFEKIEPPTPAGSRVTATEYFGTIPLLNRISLVQGTGGTTALITLGIASDDLVSETGPEARLDLFGRLQMESDSSRVFTFSATRGTAAAVPRQEIDGREYRLYEIRGVIPPGEYQVNLGVRTGERFGGTKIRLRVGDFEGKSLQIAGPILSEETADSQSPGGPGFTLGGLHLMPKLVPVFHPEADLGFYFQVIHASPGADDDRLHLDIAYGVAVRQKGLFVPLGKPVVLTDNHAPAHAYFVPLKGWSAGEYLLSVTASDRVSGQVAAATASFLVQ